jgi:hexosaminidase
MWVEYASAETVDSRIWPRAAAIAERLWSPKEVTDVNSMYQRMESVSRWLEWTGIQHRAAYGPMLDRLAGSVPEGRPGSAESLRILADASEALGLGPRARARKYTSLVPLNRFVDAVRPESETIRGLEQAATRATPEDLARLREQFTTWAANDDRFELLAGSNALLAELKPLSHDLSTLGATGLKALDYLAAAQSAPAAWVADRSTEATRMLRPNAEVTLAAARPVLILLNRLAKQAQR